MIIYLIYPVKFITFLKIYLSKLNLLFLLSPFPPTRVRPICTGNQRFIAVSVLLIWDHTPTNSLRAAFCSIQFDCGWNKKDKEDSCAEKIFRFSSAFKADLLSEISMDVAYLKNINLPLATPIYFWNDRFSTITTLVFSNTRKY